MMLDNMKSSPSLDLSSIFEINSLFKICDFSMVNTLLLDKLKMVARSGQVPRMAA